MVELKVFLKKNNVKQVELARYLGVTEASVSNIVAGRYKLSDENLTKILENAEGWDTSMFTDGATISAGDNSVIVQGANHVHSIDNRHYYSDSPDVLKAQIELLDRNIKEKDAQIKEKDAQIKEKDAQIKTLLEILAKK